MIQRLSIAIDTARSGTGKWSLVSLTIVLQNEGYDIIGGVLAAEIPTHLHNKQLFPLSKLHYCYWACNEIRLKVNQALNLTHVEGVLIYDTDAYKSKMKV